MENKEPTKEEPIWWCEKRYKCKWKCFCLSSDGMALGIVPPKDNAWLQWHTRECGGRLVQGKFSEVQSHEQ